MFHFCSKHIRIAPGNHSKKYKRHDLKLNNNESLNLQQELVREGEQLQGLRHAKLLKLRAPTRRVEFSNYIQP